MQARRGWSLQNSWIDESHGEKDKICGLDEQVLGHRGKVTTLGAEQSDSLWEVVVYGKNQENKLKLNY